MGINNKKKGSFEKKTASRDSEELIENVVNVNRVSKVVTGGRRFSLSALVVVGDGKSRVGYGSGKGKEAPDAIRKAIQNAKKDMVDLVLEGSTIPYEVVGKYCSAKVLLKPAVEGTGIIAGSTVRAVVESVGIHNIVTKSMGSDNVINIVKATFEALKQLRDRKQVEQLRGVKL